MKNHYSECGLPNFGSTCYANAAVQLLLSSTYFVKELEMKYNSQEEIISVLRRKGFKMVIPYFLSLAFFAGLIKKVNGIDVGKNESMNLFLNVLGERHSLYQNTCNQQSSAEFLCDLLNEPVQKTNFSMI